MERLDGWSEQHDATENGTIEMARRATPVCIYCEAKPGIEPDHVPPVGLIPLPRPSSLITVPACAECNRGYSMDDQYFQFFLASRNDLQDHPAVQQVSSTVQRGLNRPESKGLLKGILASSRVSTVAEDGTSTPRQQMQYQPAWNRIDNVVKRVVKGLYYYEFGKIMPQGRVDVWSDQSEFMQGSGIQNALPLSSILETLRADTTRVVLKEVFEYSYSLTVGDPEMTTWLLTFYSRAWFLVLANWERHAGQNSELADRPAT